jgi:hypothetical protein
MAKPVIVVSGESEISFDIVKIDRSKIYGSRKRIAIDVDGNQCSRAALLADGSELLTSGMTAQGYFTETGRPVARQEMVGIDDKGTVVATKPSTLGVPQKLEGPVDPSEVLNLSLESVFYLDALSGIDSIEAQLKEGKVFKFLFNYSAGFEVETAYLVANDEGYFALVGACVSPQWIEEAEIFVPDESSVDDSEDLDFDDL